MASPRFKCVYSGCKHNYIPKLDQSVHFIAFPKDVNRTRQWIESINANSKYPLLSTVAKNGHLCHRHFEAHYFTNSNCNRVNKFAIPTIFVEAEQGDISLESSTTRNIEIVDAAIPSTSQNNAEINLCSQEPCTPPKTNSDNHVATPSISRKTSCIFSDNSVIKRRNCGILSAIDSSKSSLTPRKQKMYRIYRNQLSNVCKLRTKLEKTKNHVKAAHHFSNTKSFKNLEKNLDPAGVRFLRSQFEQCTKKKPRWNVDNKVFAIALYKNGPRSYRFLQKFLCLPSKSTLKKFSAQIPFEPGINHEIFQKLKVRASKMISLDRHRALVFDEIALAKNITDCKETDKIDGFVDVGHLGRKKDLAKHGLVFLVKGIRKNWKQPIAYFFTHHTIATHELKILIRDIIRKLHTDTMLIVTSTVCDQGATNSSALKQLVAECRTDRPGNFFLVGDKPIYTFFDTPHALKNPRTTFCNYDVEYTDENGVKKIAKFRYLKEALRIDETVRYRHLYKIQRSHLEDLD